MYSTTIIRVICHLELVDDRNVHHDHETGKTFGLAYNHSDIRHRIQSFNPVFFRNLSRYDSHHLIKNLSLKKEEKLTEVPSTEEILFSVSLQVTIGSYKNKTSASKTKYEERRFLDSFRFLPDS